MDGMRGRMQRTAAGTWAVAVSALFLSLAAAPILAQEPSPVSILDSIKDFGSDPDSDGLYEYLVLGVPLKVERADVYTVGAQVFAPGSDAALSRAGQTGFLDAGEQSVKLTFGAQALASLPAGQLLSFRIVVSDSSQKALDIRTHVSPAAYSGSMFEGAPGPATPEFTGRVVERAEVVDPAGHFGYLNVTFELRNLTAKNVELGGTLNRLVRGTGILRTRDPANRTALAELRFDGGAIRDLGVPGPYEVTARLVLDNANEVAADYRTAAYNSSDFVRPVAPVAFTGNGTDSGADRDADGLFDQLRISVEVAIALEGAYAFKAGLLLPERYRKVQDLAPRASATLEFTRPGTFLVTFDLSGPVLQALQLDGPYTILLDAFSERVLYIANGTYTTGRYHSAQFEPPRLSALFSGAPSEEAQDVDRDGRFDVLVVAATADVSLAGGYQLAGAIFSGGRFLTSSEARMDLGPGQQKVMLKFDGLSIGRAGLDGPYTIMLYLGPSAKDRPGLGAYLPPDRLELRTKAYRAAEFETRAGQGKPLPPPKVPELKLGEEVYTLRAAGITVEMNRSAPDLTFFYTLDDGRSARFRLVFTQLAAYQDQNGNGVHDAGEERFISPLALAGWEASKVEFSDEQGGRVLRYDLTGVLDLWAVARQAGSGVPLARLPQWGRLTFSFTLSSRDQAFERPLAFSLRGGSELKIDILIEPGRDLPGGVTGLALQHFLSDESGQNFFKTFESDRTQTFRPGSAGANGTVFRQALSAISKIGLAGTNDREHGYYSWLPQVLVEGRDGTSRYMPVNLSYSTDGLQMALALNYPLPDGTVSLLHDPTVGVNATNAPEPFTITVGRIFNPLFFVVAIALAVAVVVYILRSQRDGE